MAAVLNEVGGEPNSWPRFKHGPRFACTGQIRLPEVSLYHYKARAYDPIEGVRGPRQIVGPRVA